MRDIVADVTRATVRCGVLALVLALTAGPGATIAFAEPKDRRSQTAQSQNAPEHKKQAASKRSEKSSHRTDRMEREDSVAKPARATRRPAVVTPDALVVDSVVLTDKKAKPSVQDLLEIAPGVVTGQALGSSTVSFTFSSSSVGTRRMGPAGSTTATNQTGARSTGQSNDVAAAAQDPERISSLLDIPAAAQADVPLYVALLGLLLVAVGARNVGRFRRVSTEDPDLTWD